MRAFRTRMIVRAVFIDIVGYALILLNTGVGVILPMYAALFVAALLIVRWSTRALIVVSAVLLVLSPPLMIVGMTFVTGAGPLSDLLGGPLSAIALAPGFVAGLAFARLDLDRIRTALTAVIVGGAAITVGLVAKSALAPRLYQATEEALLAANPSQEMPDVSAVWPGNAPPVNWTYLFATSAHSATTFETLVGVGASLVVAGLAILLSRFTLQPLRPLAAAGRVALTLYVVQFVALWGLTSAGVDTDLSALPAAEVIVGGGTVLLGALLSLRGTGPMERLLRLVDRAFTDVRAARVG